MIVVDTNVVSEPLRPVPDRRVLEWLERHLHDTAITTVTVGELRYGVERLPAGRRRQVLGNAIDVMVFRARDRLLCLDEASARQYGVVRARREAAGTPISVEDAMIAGICLAGGHELATRNSRDFEGLGLRIHEPWRGAAA